MRPRSQEPHVPPVERAPAGRSATGHRRTGRDLRETRRQRASHVGDGPQRFATSFSNRAFHRISIYSNGPMDESRDASSVAAREGSDFEREWTEILNELRVALPGVQ